MSSIKNILGTKVKKAEIHEYLAEKLKDAGFGGVDIFFTPMGTRVTIYAMRPGRVIGPRGKTIKEITEDLEKRFGVENPNVTVAEIEIPELNPHVMAHRIAQALQRGVRHRRVAFWALRRMMDVGARGVEIEISGKLTSARHRTEKFSAGIMPKSGDYAMRYVRIGRATVLLKSGIFGVKVKIYPPDTPMPEEVEIKHLETLPERSQAAEGSESGKGSEGA